MLRKNYLMILNKLLLSSFIVVISGCSFLSKEPEIVVQTKIIERNIPTQPRPKKLELYDIKWYAVTSENFEEFNQKFEAENGNLVFFAISVPSYENMSLNMADIKRYLEQQKALIIYYEESVKPKGNDLNEKTE